jgi:hypothetical protein
VTVELALGSVKVLGEVRDSLVKIILVGKKMRLWNVISAVKNILLILTEKMKPGSVQKIVGNSLFL